jgi:acetylglutamate kinase
MGTRLKRRSKDKKMPKIRQKSMEVALSKAEVLIEALPWMRQWSGATIVIKYGGSAMENLELRSKVLEDILLLKLIGVRVVLVHGGGKAISSLMGKLGLEVSFKQGMRVTDDDTMKAVQMALVGQVNTSLVEALNKFGHYAVGLTGADGCILRAEPLDLSLGRVGKICEVDVELIETILGSDYIPVVASVGFGDGGSYNVNADFAASQIAVALGADKLFFLTDVDGLYADFGDKDSLIAQMGVEEAKALIGSKGLSSGMIPKISAAVESIEGGVGQATILNGTSPHSILIELFTNEGIGTEIHKEI